MIQESVPLILNLLYIYKPFGVAKITRVILAEVRTRPRKMKTHIPMTYIVPYIRLLTEEFAAMQKCIVFMEFQRTSIFARTSGLYDQFGNCY